MEIKAIKLILKTSYSYEKCDCSNSYIVAIKHLNVYKLLIQLNINSGTLLMRSLLKNNCTQCNKLWAASYKERVANKSQLVPNLFINLSKHQQEISYRSPPNGPRPN